MSVWRLVFKEILHRRLNFVLGLVCVAAAVGCLVGALTLLDVHDACTQRILARKEAQTRANMARLEDEMRKATLKLGFNIVILPKEQKLEEWYADDSSSFYMPQDYPRRLAEARIITVQHLLGVLQARRPWPEKKRTIILVGTPGEPPGGEKKPLIEPIPPGQIVLGFELHEGLGLNAGDKLTLMGREFTVRQWHPMRGNKDDITAWIDLPAAQEMLDKPGQINAILALECSCAFADLPKVRQEIARVLPETQVIERGSEAITRAEARTKVADEALAALQSEKDHRAQLRAQRENLASVLVPLVMVVAAVWVALLALGNVRQRRSEIGLLRAIGVRGGKILLLFLVRAVLIGLVGGAVGCLAGYAVGKGLGAHLEQAALPPVAFAPLYAALGMVLAPVLAAVASLVPALVAAQQDPADILQEE